MSPYSRSCQHVFAEGISILTLFADPGIVMGMTNVPSYALKGIDIDLVEVLEVIYGWEISGQRAHPDAHGFNTLTPVPKETILGMIVPPEQVELLDAVRLENRLRKLPKLGLVEKAKRPYRYVGACLTRDDRLFLTIGFSTEGCPPGVITITRTIHLKTAETFLWEDRIAEAFCLDYMTAYTLTERGIEFVELHQIPHEDPANTSEDKSDVKVIGNGGKKKKKRRGRPKLDENEVRLREILLNQVEARHENGRTIKEIADELGYPYADLINFRQWKRLKK
jgi:hypothetical protein